MKLAVRNALLAFFSILLISTSALAAEASEHPKYVKAVITSSLTGALNQKLGAGHGDALSAHAARLLIWWVNLKKDILKGDEIEILYKDAPMPAQYEIHAIRYKSRKKEQTFSAFLYNRHYYDENGVELEERLKHTPIHEYDQVTERMNLAGRNHRGVDFKADAGTPLYAPYNGVVVRIWSTPVNGNSLKIKLQHEGQYALYLHLSKIEPGLHEGSQVKAGQKVAEVGNTGRSTAAHLHYEIHNKNDEVRDPFLMDETYHKHLPTSYVDSFTEWRNYYLSLLNHKH